MDDQHHHDNLLMTVPEAAEALKVSKPTAYRLIRSGTLRARRVGPDGPIRVARADLDRVLVDVQPDDAA